MDSSRLSAHTPAVPTLARRPLSNRLALALGLLALGGCSAFQPPASAAVNAPHVTAKAGPDSQAPHGPTKPGNQATGNSPWTLLAPIATSCNYRRTHRNLTRNHANIPKNEHHPHTRATFWRVRLMGVPTQRMGAVTRQHSDCCRAVAR